MSRIKTTQEEWVEELTRPKLTIAQRLALWVGPPRIPEAPASPPEPDHYVWHSAHELIERARK